MEHVTIDRITMVGGGRHMRLRLRAPGHSFPLNAIYFSATPESTSVQLGDVVDVAFNAQINDYRGERTVQMNLLDIRPSCSVPCSAELYDYGRIRTGEPLSNVDALLPDRATLADIWRYLASCGPTVQEPPLCLCRKIVRHTGKPLSLGKLLTCLDIFADVGLLNTQRLNKYILIHLTPGREKADLNRSRTLQILLRTKER